VEPSGTTPGHGKMTGTLARWAREAGAAERRTVVLRPEYSTAPEDAERDLRGLGAQIESAGAGAIVVAVTPAALAKVLDLPWVRAVEEPRTLQPRFPAR
jgi:hypothetical protein